ncbi:hypothetical protein [Candidatus Colwellia aromaticivorans]|uniref:hypothetical protein n=1 Tax=Candidatus Colwellia aromaticivorans TaxID=2267621 RepID=UPI000DF1D544|nr:hypothetical protein [Candidatus Colwellia aromaticivorans]
MVFQHCRIGKSYVPSRKMRVITHFTIVFFFFGQLQAAVAGTKIVTTTNNGWTTNAATNGSVTEITGARQIGSNSYNSFEHFGVKADNTVNFRLNGADNLVNLVTASRSDINGVLNAYRDAGNTVGGNLFFVNPHGITVGAAGVVNVGSLSMAVPTQAAMDDYISALQDGASSADERLLFIGDLQLAENGEINIQGTINAQGGVLLLANKINVGADGGIFSVQSTYASGAELFSALVNVSDDFQDELAILEVDGDLVIGAAGLSGGIINDINPVKNTSASVVVEAGATIQAEGDIHLVALAKQTPARIDNGLVEWNTTSATVDIDDASITSSNGAISIDAKASVDLNVGGFDGAPISAAIAKSDALSSVNITNSTITSASDVTISSSAKTTISAIAKAESSTATLTLAVASIKNDSSAVVDGSTTINSSGDVAVNSQSDMNVKVVADGLLNDGSGGGLAIAITDADNSSIATVTDNAQIVDSATIAITSSVSNLINTSARSVVTGDPQTISDAVNNDDNLKESNDTELKTNIDTSLDESFNVENDEQTSSPQFAGAFAYTDIGSSSQAIINSFIDDVNGAKINADGRIELIAKSLTDGSNLAKGTTADGADTGISAGISILNSKELINASVAPEQGKLTVTAVSLKVAALNEDHLSADNEVGDMASLAYSGGNSSDLGVAGAFAINIQDRDTTANISGDNILMVDVNGDLDVVAASQVSDTVKASATLSTQEQQQAENKFSDSASSNEEGAAGVGVAIAINVLSNTTDARIGSGVDINNVNNVSLVSNSQSNTTVNATAGVAPAQEGAQSKVGVGASIALSVIDNTTHAVVEGNDDTLLSSGGVNITADHENSINVTSDGSAAGDSASVGASIAISVSDADTQALLSRDVEAGSVTLNAISNTSNSSVAKASAAGAEEDEEETEPPTDPDEKTGVDKQASGLTQFASDKKADDSEDTPEAESAETPGGSVSVAAGLAITTTEATVSAQNTGSITTTGQTQITTAAAADSKAEGDGSAVDGSNSVGIGVAVAVNSLNQSNTATARHITSNGGLTVSATQIEDEINDTGATATSGAGAANVGVAGSVAVNVVNNRAAATYADGTVSSGDVIIKASNDASSTTKAGASIEGEGDSVGVGAGIAIDVGVNDTLALIASDADITGSDSVVVDADSTFAADLKGEAGQGEGADGGSVGVNATVAVGVYSNNTQAEIAAADTTLLSAGAVHVGASNTNTIAVETNAEAAGSTAAVGASIAIGVSNTDTQAMINRNVNANSVELIANSSSSNVTKAKAGASGAKAKEEEESSTTADEEPSVNKDVDSWQTFASDKDDSGSTSDTETEKADASSSEGQVSVAAAVAVAVTDIDTVAKINKGVIITATNDISVSSLANTDAKAVADGSAVGGDIGVGVGVGINVANNNNLALIDQGADVQGGNISVSALMKENTVEGEDDPDNTNTFVADATSGAGAAKVGVAGSLALNVVTNHSRAYIAGDEGNGVAARVYSQGVLGVTASNNASHVTTAKASATGSSDDSSDSSSGSNNTGAESGKSVGIGASVSINTFTNKTQSEIGNGVTIGGERSNVAIEAGSLSMAATSKYQSQTKTEAGAEGEEGADPANDIAIDAAVALVVADNETTVAVGETNNSSGYSGDINLTATSEQSNTTEADGDTAGSSVAIGAVVAANLATSVTGVTINGDLKTSAGAINLTASSTSADKALAKASAKGASKKKVQDKYGATEEEVDSGDFGNGADDNKATSTAVLSDNASAMEQSDTGNNEADNKSGDKGKWNVSVAAAVGVNVVNNETSVKVASDKALAADSSINVSATSDSNYMTLGSGEAVANTGEGGGIGIGIGVAVTVTDNDTLAEVASIDNAADVTIAANSKQNMHDDFIKELTSEAIAGASADKVGVAGAVATVVTNNNTQANILDQAIIGDINALNVTSDDQSKISSRAIAWVDPAKKTTAGVGASAAILVSKNKNIARIGDGVSIDSAHSINVAATNHRVTPETVGLNFDDIINFNDVLDSALLAGRTTASNDDSENTGTEPEVDPKMGGPSLIFDELKSQATDAKHALEDYIRSHNYYTEAAAGSASTSGSAKYGVAGSFAVTVLQNQTEASIGNATINNVAGNVDVSAETDTDIAGFTGSVVKAGSVGVGVSATTLVNLDSTQALVGNNDGVGVLALGSVDVANNIGGLNVNASSDQDILGIGVSAAAASSSSDSEGGGGVAVSGVLTTAVLINEVKAQIANDAKVYSTGGVDISAEGLTDIVTVVGGISLADKVGVGASIGTSVISGQTHALIGDRANVLATDSVNVAATAQEDIISIVVGAGASKKVGVAGSVATNIIAASTTATIGQNAIVTQTDARNAEGEVNTISIKATDNSNLFSLAGGGAIGGKAGVGAAADVAVFSKNTVAESKSGSVLSAEGNVEVTAKSKDDIASLTGAGAASSSGAAVAGVASVKVVVNTTHALLNSQSVNATGNVDLLAQSDTDLNIYDGTIAISGGSAGVGGAVAVNTLVKDTAARVGAGVDITTRGDLSDSQVYSGDVDRSGFTQIGTIDRPDSDDKDPIAVSSGELTDAEKQTIAHRGLSVTAFSTEDIETIGISASASKSVAVAGNLSVDVITNTTDAAIGADARVNASGVDPANNSASVFVQSFDYTDLNSMLGSGAVGVSSAGVGAAGDVSVISKTTTAHIDARADIDAEQDVVIRAGAESDIDSVAAAVGVGSTAGVSGSASVLVINNETRAYSETNLDNRTTTIDAGRDFIVEAQDNTNLFVFNTALAAGSTAGVGGSAGIVVMTSQTEAKLGRGTVSNTNQRTVISADSREKIIGIAMGAAGGGTAGVSGQLAVHVLASDTKAIVEDNVTINKESWVDAAAEEQQSVAVLANNNIELLSISGTISLGGTAGVGGALTADVVQNHVRASVGDSEIYAGSIGNGNVDLGNGVFVEDGVSVRATSEKDLTAVSIAGSAGGTAGVAGAASILIVGSDFDEQDNSSDSFGGDMETFSSTGDDADESSQFAVADSGSESRTGDTLGAQGDVEVSSGVTVSQFVDDNSQTSGSEYFSLDSASGVTGDTVAVVASGAKIQTKGDLEISANDDTSINVVGGSIAVGGTAGVGGSGALVLLNQGTRALVQDDDINAVELDAARELNINAQAYSKIFDVTATVSAAGAAAVSGSLLLNVVDSRVEASIGDNALINQDNLLVADNNQSVILDANNSINLVATTANASGSGTAAVGGVALVNVINSRTNATIGNSAQIKAMRDVKVIADGSEQVIANGASAAISGVAGVGGVINVNTINTSTQAKINAGAVVDSDGNILLASEDDTSLIANSWGVAIGIGGAGVGGSFGVNTIIKNTSAVIEEGATVNARGNNAAMIDVYTGKLVNPNTGDNLVDGLISRIEGGEDDDPQESGSSGPSEEQSQGQADKWQGVVDESGANKGEDDLTLVDTPSLNNNSKQSEMIKGLAVIASSTEDIISSNASAAGGLYAGVSGSGQVLTVETKTDATVEKGVTVDTADLRLSAADHTSSLSLSGGLAISGVAGVGGAVANGNFIKNTQATLGTNAEAGNGVNVTASGDVIVTADGSEDIDEILVNVAGAGIAGVGGGIGVHVVVSDTTAEVGNNGVIAADSDLNIRANSHTEIDALNGNLSLAGIAAVGAAIGTNVVANRTMARIGDGATTDADDITEVTANSVSDIRTITVAASGGAVGVAGGIQVNVIDTTAQASIGLGAFINSLTSGNVGQSVMVNATDSSTIDSDTGAIALGAVGVGGAVSVDILRNSALAKVGEDADIIANNSINIAATTVKNLDSKAVSAAAGGFGMSGSIAVAAVGGDLNDDAYKEINGEDANGDQNSDSGSVNKAGTSSSVNPLASDDENSQLNDFSSTASLADDVDERNTERETDYGVSDDVASSADPRSGTLADIGNGATLKAGGNLNVIATDTTNTNLLTGAIGVGGVAGAGAASITVIGNNTKARVGGNTTLDSGAQLSVSAINNKTLNATAASGAVSGAGSIAGSIGVTVDSSQALAQIESGANINQDLSTQALITEQNVAVNAINNANIDVKTGAISASFGAGIGGTLNVVTTSQTTQALIDVGATGRVSAEGLIKVDADSNAISTAQSAVGAGGFTAGIAGGAVTLSDSSTTSALIGAGSIIDGVDGDDNEEVKVTADSTRTATADTKGAAIGAIGVGGSAATVEMNGFTTASIADNTKLGINNAIGSLEVKANAVETATAKAIALSAGIISGAGGVATTEINSTVSALTGDNSIIVADGAVAITAQATPKALSRSTAGSFGGATVGASIADVDVAPTVSTSVNGSHINADSLLVSAKVLNNGRTADGYAEAASGGLLLGANATVANTSVTGKALTTLGLGTWLNIVGDTSIVSQHNSDQYAETKSFAAGLAALGGAFSTGEADTISTINVADGSTIAAGSLILNANGNDKNLVKAKSGSGGAVAGAAAVTDTDNTSITSVSVGDGTITSDNIDIDATHTARFDHSADSTSGGLLGASGAVADNTVDALVTVSLAGNIEAGIIDARTSNNVNKNLQSGYNINAGAGGLLGGAAADSQTTIQQMTSTITQGAQITSGDQDDKGITFEAANNLLADDSAKLDSGGAIAIALADTSVVANNVIAAITFGDQTSVETGGDLIAAAYSNINIQVDTKSSTYGLAGAAQGESTARVNVSNSVNVAGADLLSDGQTKLLAGRSANDRANSNSILAYTDIWNKTAFPVETKPEANAYLFHNNVVDVDNDSTVKAGGNIYLVADEGSTNVKGQGTGKDLYRQAAEDTVNFFGDLVGADDVSFDITGGTSTNISIEQVNNDGIVNAGINNKEKFRIVRNEDNNDLEFYEGDYVDGMMPTLVIRDTANGLIGIDDKGNEFAIAIDGDGNYVVAPSKDGLSTTVKLDLDFNPLQVMLDRLDEVNSSLDDIFLKSGGLTAAQVIQRDTLFREGQGYKADSEQALAQLDNVYTLDSDNVVTIFAGVRQLRGAVVAADTEVDNDQKITTSLTLWQNQKAALDAEAQAWLDGDSKALIAGANADQTAAVVADLHSQSSEIQDNLIVHAEAINSDFTSIDTWRAQELADPDNVDNSSLIAAAQVRITANNILLNNFDSSTLAARETTLVAEEANKSALSEQAFTDRDDITPNESNIDATLRPYVNRLEQERDWIQGRVDDYGGASAAGVPSLTYQSINFTDKLFATSADIVVDSRGLGGSGSLIANRDTEISILNKTPAYLQITGGAEIPFDAGGNIYVNDVPIRSATLGNQAIGDGTDNPTKIKFLNDYAPPGMGGTSLEPPQGPDLILSENISNFNGLIHLESLFGGVTTDAGVRIDGDTIVIRAGRDVVLSYAGGIRHIAGDVKCDFSAAADCTPASGIVPGVVAGNNVYVAGEFININGKIQSGLPERTITINGTAAGQFENGGLVSKEVDEQGQTYFEVSPLFIAGGYVDLYGHIISTPVDKTNTAVGEIQVMDGYGDIEVINNTSLDVRITNMSAGTGVKAKVRITDLDFDLNLAGHDKVSEYTYYRDNAAGQRVDVTTSYLGTTSSEWKSETQSNNLNYSPLAGQQYSWENIRKDGWSQDRDVVRETYFVLFGGDDVEVDRDTKSKVFSIDQAPIKDDLVVKARPAGTVADATSNGAYATKQTTTNTTSSGWSQVSGSYDKDEYVVYRHEEWKERRTGTDFVYVKNFVKADHPIAINFVGNSTGSITLTSAGDGNGNYGNIDIAGSILNPTGLTTINAGDGDIVQSNASAILWTKDLSLSGRSIGEATVAPQALGAIALALADNSVNKVFVPLEINLAEGGRLLDANVGVGDLVIEELDGDLLIGEMSATNGDVWLKASGDILNDEAAYPTKNNKVTGERVTLISQGGAVGTSDNAIRVNSDASADGGVIVSAATNINVTETDGDLYLVSATASTGDVNINVANGTLVDNNSVETRDTRTIEQLLGIWDSMEFITETSEDNGVNSTGNVSEVYDVAARNVTATETLKTREYHTYWNYRNKLADPSVPVTDTTITLSDTEASFFDNPQVIADERSDEFARLNDLYGDIGNTYIKSYQYQVIEGTKEYQDLTKRAGWTELELLALFGPGLLKEISDTKIRIEEANVTGHHVNITVENGDIGTYVPDDILIDLDTVADYTELSDEQKLALLTAERKDVRLANYDEASESYRQMWISTYEDVDVEASGTLSANAVNAQRIYLGSEGDLAINNIAGSGDIRIRTNGNLTGASAGGNSVVTGTDIILESGSQSIGSEDQPFIIEQLAGGSVTARAGNNIWLQTSQNNPLAIDTVFASNLFSLTTTADVVEYEPDAGIDVRADSIDLNIAGSFGVGGDLINSLDIGLNPQGILTANILNSAWITSPDRNMRIGRFDVGASSRIVGNKDINLQSEHGGITSNSGKFTLLADGSIFDELKLTLNDDDEIINEDDGSRAITAVELELIATKGDLASADNALDIEVAGGVWVQAEKGSIYLEQPDSDLHLQNVTAANDAEFSSGGDILLLSGVGEFTTTSGRLSLTATGSISDEDDDTVLSAVELALHAINGSIAADHNTLTVNVSEGTSLVAKQGAAFIDSPASNLNLRQLELGASSRLTSGADIVRLASAEKFVSTDGSLLLEAQGSILDEDDETRLTAVELDLVAKTGSIGSADNALTIETSGARGLAVDAQQADAFVDNPDSSLALRQLLVADNSNITAGSDITLIESGQYQSTSGTLSFTADESIFDLSGDSLIQAVDLELQANHGSIGSTTRSLHLDTQTITYLSAAKGTYLTEINGDMNISFIHNDSEAVVLKVVEQGAGLNIFGGLVDGKMLWNADNIFADNLVHGGNESELYFEVTSSTGAMADDVTIMYQSDDKVRFGTVETQQALILGDVKDVKFDHILLGETGLFTNDATSVFIDHTDNSLRSQYNIQLYSKDAPFFLNFIPDRKKITTDAFIIYYDPDWIVNAFSTENSMTRLVAKDLAYLTGPITNVVEQVKHPDNKKLVKRNDGAINLPYSNEATSVEDLTDEMNK